MSISLCKGNNMWLGLCTSTADTANAVLDLIFVAELESISLTGHNSIKRSKTLPFSKEKQE